MCNVWIELYSIEANKHRPILKLVCLKLEEKEQQLPNLEQSSQRRHQRRMKRPAWLRRLCSYRLPRTSVFDITAQFMLLRRYHAKQGGRLCWFVCSFVEMVGLNTVVAVAPPSGTTSTQRQSHSRNPHWLYFQWNRAASVVSNSNSRLRLNAFPQHYKKAKQRAYWPRVWDIQLDLGCSCAL